TTALLSPLSLFFSDPATTEIYTLSLHDALPISGEQWGARQRAAGRPDRGAAGRTGPAAGLRAPRGGPGRRPDRGIGRGGGPDARSEEHTSELQSRENLVCRLLLEKKKHTDTDTA